MEAAKSNSLCIGVLGHCQGRLIAQSMQILAPSVRTEFVLGAPLRDAAKRTSVLPKLEKFNVVFTHAMDARHGPFSTDALRSRDLRLVTLPTVAFEGFHPDSINVAYGRVKSPIGDYHSSLTLWAFLRGLTPQQAMRLFNRRTFERVGFFDLFTSSLAKLRSWFEAHKLDGADMVNGWAKRGVFMHTVNHPHAYVLADTARLLLRHIGQPVIECSPERLMVDNFPDSAVWPVYPEIADRHGTVGDYVFKKAKGIFEPNESPVIGLEEMVTQSFEIYAKHKREDLTAPRLESGLYDERLDPAEFKTSGPARSRSNNPYQGKPDYQFWRRSVASVPMSDVDVVIRSPLTVQPTDAIATAGSCFAQHISRRLSKSGYRYLVSEQAPDSMPPEEAQAANYGVYSARYGNLYTARQLLQLFDRAYERFEPNDVAWSGPDQRWVDPFRPQIEPGGFATREALLASRRVHFASVRRMFETLDVFVFTLGLTEGWRSKLDGAVFPLAPGVAGGEMDDARYEFVNFEAASVREDLEAFVQRLRQVNREARMLLTVSPVPLIATYEDQHVLVSNTYSKAVLRVAADEVARAVPSVGYFPSYEVITGGYNRGAYFESDLRSVNSTGVDHVMRLFMKHCTERGGEPIATHDDDLQEVVCDEEAIDPG